MSVPSAVRDILDAPGWICDIFVRSVGSLATDYRPGYIGDLTGKVAIVTGGK